MKNVFFKVKFFEYDPSVYFVFAITVAYFELNKISFGFELFNSRILFFEYKRKLPKSNDKMDVFVGEINYK